jgi:hypothetical protein
MPVVVVAPPVAPAEINHGRRDIVRIRLIDHGWCSDADTDIYRSARNGGRGKRNNTNDKAKKSLSHDISSECIRMTKITE